MSVYKPPVPALNVAAEIVQAERCADQLVEQLLNEDLLHIGIPILHPDAGQIDACAKIKGLFAGEACFRAEILSAALNGYMPARIALGELVQEIDENKWPSELTTYAKACANPNFNWPTRPGPQRLTHLYSDIAAVMVILELSNRFPSIPTTSHSARQTCHCDLAAGAFNRHKDHIGRLMNRGQVKQVWKRYKQLTIHKIRDSQILNEFNQLPG